MASTRSCCFIVILGVICVSITAKKEICSKILFKNVKESEMPLVQIEGVYEKTSMTHDDFPVYKSEETGLYFYYSYDPDKKIKMFAFGEQVDGVVFGLVAKASTKFDPKTWPIAENVNRYDVFGNIIEDWFYYFPLEKTFKKVYSVDKIKAFCTENDVIQCDSTKLYLNDTIASGSVVLNDPTSDYFAKLTGVYSSIRPVYKHSRQEWYLHYKESYWRIGNSYTSTTSEIFYVEDHALKPEYVTGIWKVWTGTRWTAARGLRLLCRGIANGKNQCQGISPPCRNSGSCVYTKGNESVCVCNRGSYGVYCQETTVCTRPRAPPSSVSVSWADLRPGGIATSFCARGYRYQPTEFYVCEAGKSWVLESKESCQVQPPTQLTQAPLTFLPRQIPTTSPPWKPSLDFLIFFGPCLAFQMVVPAFIFAIVSIARIIRVARTTPSGSSERIESVMKIYGQRYWVLLRTYSAFLNFMFWPWCAFVLVCAFTDFKDVHSYLLYCAMGMCGFCALFVAIEGYLCAQRAALRNIVTCDYITRMQAASPVIEIILKRNAGLEFYEAYRTNAYGDREYIGTRSRRVYQKVVREPFVYTTWKDDSEKDVSFKRRWTRIDLQMDIKLGDEVTELAFKTQQQNLVHKNRNLSTNRSLSRQDYLPKFQPHVLLCSDANSVPWWMREKYFWIATLCQMSWVYRAYFNHKTGFQEYVLTKRVFCKPVDSTSQTGFQQHSEDDEMSQAGPSSSSASENKPLVDFASQSSNKNYLSI